MTTTLVSGFWEFAPIYAPPVCNLLTERIRRDDSRGGHHCGDRQRRRHGAGGSSQQLHLLSEEEALFQYTT